MVFLYSSHFKSGFGTHFEFCEFWRWRQLNIGTSASPYNERLLELSKPIWSSHDVSMDYMTGKRHNILCKLRRWLDTPIVLWQYVWMPGKEGLNKKGLIPPRTPVGLWKSSAGKAKMSCYKRAHFLTGHVKEGQLPLSFHKVLQKKHTVNGPEIRRNQLRLVVYPIVFKVLAPSQVAFSPKVLNDEQYFLLCDFS